jgi:hypothetical protein
MMTMTSRRWRVGQCAGSADQPWLTALNQLQPTSGVRKAELAQGLLDQGRNVAEYLAVLPSRTHA